MAFVLPVSSHLRSPYKVSQSEPGLALEDFSNFFSSFMLHEIIYSPLYIHTDATEFKEEYSFEEYSIESMEESESVEDVRNSITIAETKVTDQKSAFQEIDSQIEYYGADLEADLDDLYQGTVSVRIPESYDKLEVLTFTPPAMLPDICTTSDQYDCSSVDNTSTISGAFTTINCKPFIADHSLKVLDPTKSDLFIDSNVTTSTFIAHSLPQQTLSRTPTSLITPVRNLRFSKYYQKSAPLTYSTIPLDEGTVARPSEFQESARKVVIDPLAEVRNVFDQCRSLKTKLLLVFYSFGTLVRIICRATSPLLGAKFKIRPPS